MNPFEMVVVIVLIVAIAGVFKSRNQARHGKGDDSIPVDRGDYEGAAQLQNEVKALKERISVLERLATDDQRNLELDREIAKLRDPKFHDHSKQ